MSSEGHEAKLNLSGSYTLANFSLASDGAGGTIVYDPPLATSNARTSASGSAAIGNGTMLDSAIGDARSVNVIIGAGFTGSALTIQLLRQLRHGSHILLVGVPGSIGRGLAYGTRVEQHLLNVRANRMSILSDDSDHFVNWLAAAEEGFPLEGAADSYAKRLVYGRYIRETARAGDREKTRSCRV